MNDLTAEEWKKKGNQLFQEEDIDGSLDAFTNAINLESDNAVYFANRAAAYTFKGEFTLAITDANKAIELNSGYAKAWLRLAMAQFRIGLYEKAMESFKRTTERANSNSDTDKSLRDECLEHIKLCEKNIQDQKELEEAGRPNTEAKEDIQIVEYEGRPVEEEESKPKPPLFSKLWWIAHLHIGNVANYIAFIIAIAGFILKFGTDTDDTVSKYVLSCGLMAVTGGFTNFIAIKMLFDKMILPGSGIIPARFKEIRLVVKNVIMKNFFDEKYLNYYLKNKILAFDLEKKLEDFLAGERFVKLLEGALGNDGKVFLPFIKPYLMKLSKMVGPLLKEKIQTMNLADDLGQMKEEIDNFLTDRLKDLTAEKVKVLLEDIMREHLNWLIFWGTVFGGCLGIICAAIGLP